MLKAKYHCDGHAGHAGAHVHDGLPFFAVPDETDLLTENEQLRATIATKDAVIATHAFNYESAEHDLALAKETIAALTAKVEELTRAAMTNEMAETAARVAAKSIEDERFCVKSVFSLHDIILSAINRTRGVA